MFVITNKKIFLLISLVLSIVSLLFVFVRGLPVGIDFAGGSLTEVTYQVSIDEENPVQAFDIESSLLEAGFSSVLVQPTQETSFFIRTLSLSESERVLLLDTLGTLGSFQEDSFTSIGPSLGRELQNKALVALIIVALAIIMFIAYVFRSVSKPVSSWKYGFVAVVTLLHDVILTTGAFGILSMFVVGVEVNALFVVALLTVLGLSVNDTIVVFDRIRENLKENKDNKPFKEVVGMSLSETYTRSINTSVSTLIVLIVLAVLGPASTKVFALTLAFGMFFGTYSSIFLASPLLVLLSEKSLIKKK